MATYYMTQSGAGTKAQAVSISTPMSVATHNGETFAADDIIYLLDTITSLVAIPSSGSAGSPIVYRGDYSGRAGTISGGGSITQCITATSIDYFNIVNLTCNGSSTGQVIQLYDGTGNGTDDRNITIQGCTISDAQGGTSNNNGISGWGNYISVIDCTIHTCNYDGIWIKGHTPTITGNTIYNIDLLTAGGDCIQLSGVNTDALIQNNDCDHTNSDLKQTIIGNGTGTNIRILDNTVKGYVDGTANAGIWVQGYSSATVRGNTVTGGYIGIQNLSTSCVIEGNTVVDCTDRAGISCGGAAVSAKVRHNTIDGCKDAIETNGMTDNDCLIENNVIMNSSSDGCFSKDAHTEDYNIFYNNNNDSTRTGGIGSNSQVADPLLDSTYHPTINSPCFAAGKIIFGARDFRGRSFKYPPTIGAYEFNAGAPAQTRSAATKPIVVAKQGEFTSGPNICLQSESFTTSPWSAGPNTTYTANAGTAPDGANTATDVLHNDNNEWTLQNITVSADKVYTASVYIHSGDTGTHDWVNLWYVDQTSTHGIRAWYNLTTGSVGTSQTVGFNATLQNAIMTDEGDGWYRISITGQLAPGETGGRIVIANVEADTSLVEDTAASVWYWGAQLELGYRHHPYLKTTTVAVSGEFPRDAWDVLMYSGSIVQDADGTYRMMYTGYQSDGLAYGPCIATSTDLVNWTKPNLGLISYGGNTNNNIIIVHSTHIGADLAYLDSQYVALIDSGPSNLIYTSPDGVNFTYQIIPFSDASYGSNIEAKAIIKVNGVYRIYYTAGHAAERRTVGYYESSTLTGTYVDQGDITEFTSTSQDLQYYDFKPFYYDNSWWAVVNIFNKTTELLGPHLLYRSEDLGATWKEYSTLVALGSSGTFDDELMATGRPVLMAGTWYYLYVGSQDGHDTWPRSMSWGYATGAERTTTRTARS